MPDEVTELVATTARLRTAHRQESGALQKMVDRATAVLGWPGSVMVLGAAMVVWVTANLAVASLGGAAIDPPPFAWLATVTAACALVIAMLILATQRHEDKLAEHRAQLILELSIANDQKISKIIELLEEARRDNPALTDRVDDQAQAMSTPSDAVAVLEAIKELSEDGV